MADSFSVFTSDDDDIDESKKDNEDTNDKEMVIEGNIVSEITEHEFITLEELADSHFIRSRQVAAKSIVEYLHQAGSNKEALHSVISVMCKLSEDEDLMVRSELIEQIPSIALFCKEHFENLGVVIRQQIVPYTVKLLTDIQRQIRKTGHSTLLILLENQVIDHSQLSEWICPLIAQLVTSENIPGELRLEDVSVMCKMIPYVGKEITEKFFLEPFLSICRDSSSSAREVCLLNFDTICQVVGRDTTENTLLCAFLDLCQESWEVKLRCVDIAIHLATTVSPTTRNEILSPIYMSFLEEFSHAVSHAAYLNLGRFISTFAEPTKTGLKYSNGTWINIPAENDNKDIIFQSCQLQARSFEFLTRSFTSKSKFLEECTFKNLNGTFEHDSDELSNILPSSNFNNCKLQFEGSEVYESSKYSSSGTFSNTASKFINNLKNFVEIHSGNLKLPDVSNFQNNEIKSAAVSSLNISLKKEHLQLQADNENIFNNFQFWRMPLPEVDLDQRILPRKLTNECKAVGPISSSLLRTELQKENKSSPGLPSCTLPKQSSKEPDILQNTDDNKLNKEDKNSPELNLKLQDKSLSIRKEAFKENPLFFKVKSNIQMPLNEKQMTDTEKMVYDQDIIPPDLLMEFINGITVSEDNMRESLTFYFPSVAYALGRKHWPCVRDLFNTVSSMLQFNIRKTIASSLHELAVILGPEITTEDLLPVFLRLLKDVNVRYTSSLIVNLSKFLKQTKSQAHDQLLPLIEEICSWNEYDHNWRYRLTVSEQLILCVELFMSHEALCFLPASLLIMQDKVFVVRRSGVELLAVIVKSIMENPKSSNFLKALLGALDEKYRKSHKWVWRQLYVFMCQDLAVKSSLPVEFYVEEIVPNLFSLAWDAVPNVRLAVARCLALTLFPLDFLPSIEKMNFKLLIQVLYSLQNDVDRDVRHFAHLSVPATDIFKQNVLSPEEESSRAQFKEVE